MHSKIIGLFTGYNGAKAKVGNILGFLGFFEIKI